MQNLLTRLRCWHFCNEAPQFAKHLNRCWRYCHEAQQFANRLNRLTPQQRRLIAAALSGKWPETLDTAYYIVDLLVNQDEVEIISAMTEAKWAMDNPFISNETRTKAQARWQDLSVS